tara:strand:+ start:1932 stop:2150 length:219 start_codon:yes stop_codon:yes gene_type:complete
MTETDEIFYGNVEFYDPYKSFGFILADNKTKGTFFHGTYCREKVHLEEGERVKFEEAVDKQGRTMAVNIRRL